MLRGTFQWPCPCGEPLPALTGAPPTLAGSSGWVSCGVTAPPFCVLMHTKFCLCPPRLESLVPSVLWKACDQIPLALKARFPGDSQSLCWIPRLGFRTFVIVGELLWCYYSPVCGSPTWQVWDLILLWLHLSYCLIEASSLSLDMGYLFFCGFQHPSFDGGSIASCDFGTLSGRWTDVLLLYSLGLICLC